jgi:hypothetical protein
MLQCTGVVMGYRRPLSGEFVLTEVCNMQVGVFAVNFAPAVCGPLLDWAGPRCSAVAGSAIATLGTVLLAISYPGGPDAFAGGAFCLG